MKQTALLTAFAVASVSTATAGGIDRSGQSIAPIFEDGDYVELSFGSVAPTVNGAFASGTISSSDMASSYTQLSAAIKSDFTDKVSLTLILDQPFGADVDYSNADANYPFLGSTAAVETTSLTAILRYKFSDRFAVHGGLRRTSTYGEVSIPAQSYTLETSNESDWGYLIGASYEIPDIALRAALTYNSSIDVDFTTLEGDAFASTMALSLPQSVNLDFQTGIAADTLLIASARWVDWSSFDITPTGFLAQTGSSLVSYDDDTISYSLGLGRRFNDKLSGSVAIGYEVSTGGLSGNLGPTDGNTSISLGAKYQITEATAISGGARYVWIGDATTSTIAAEFTDNSAIGFGLKLSHNF